jgi:hypothetical protein
MVTEEARLQRMLAHHQRQVDRIKDALLLLDEEEKIAKKAERLTRKVQARMGHTPTPKPTTGADFAREHADFGGVAANEIRRLVKLAKSQGHTFTFPTMSAAYYGARKEHLTGHGYKRGAAKTAKAKPTRGGKNSETAGQRMYRLRKSGDTVINRIRALFLNGSKGPLTPAQIAELARVAEVTATKRAAPAATARILVKMAQDREVKETDDGWVALNVQQPKATAQDNGARA